MSFQNCYSMFNSFDQRVRLPVNLCTHLMQSPQNQILESQNPLKHISHVLDVSLSAKRMNKIRMKEKEKRINSSIVKILGT